MVVPAPDKGKRSTEKAHLAREAKVSWWRPNNREISSSAACFRAERFIPSAVSLPGGVACLGGVVSTFSEQGEDSSKVAERLHSTETGSSLPVVLLAKKCCPSCSVGRPLIS